MGTKPQNPLEQKSRFGRLVSELRRHQQRYMQGFLVQSAQTAACNRLHNIEERLARWLLSCRDRLESDQLRLTHDFLGQMLGAPRTTVTLAAGAPPQSGTNRLFTGCGDGSGPRGTGEYRL
jgi:CRP-like cAMP-binding protein